MNKNRIAFLHTSLLPFLFILHQSSFSQQSIVLIGFKGIGIPLDITNSIAQRIESGLPRYCQCPVISQEELDGTMVEYLMNRTTQSGNNVPKSEAKVDKIVTGTLSKIGPSYSMVLKCISVKSGIIEKSVSREHTGSIEALFQFADATVAALFEEVKPIIKTDTIFVPVVTTTQPENVTAQSPKEVIPQNEEHPSSKKVVNQNKTAAKMEKIGIGALAIFAAIAAIILTNISR